MSKTVLLVGTRKGALRARERRRPPRLAGARPVLRRLARLPRGLRQRGRRDLRRGRERMARLGDLEEHRPRRDVDALVRGADLRGRPALLEGLERSRRRTARLLVGVEAPGIFESTRRRRDVLAEDAARRPAGQRGLGRPCEPAARAISASRRSSPTRSRRTTGGRSCRATACSRRPTTATTWTPRNRGLRRDWPAEHEEVGFCVHKRRALARTRSGCTSRTTSACTARDDAGQSWTEITEGLPSDFGFAAAAHPYDRDVVPRDPARPAATARTMPDGKACVWRTEDAGSTWQRARQGAAAEGRVPRRAPRGDGERHVRRRRATTSARAPARSSRARTMRELVERGRGLPAGDLVGRGRDRAQTMADLRLPPTLPPLFPDLPRRLEVRRRRSSAR